MFYLPATKLPKAVRMTTIAACLVIGTSLLGLGHQIVKGQSPPPWPLLYSGAVFLDGEPVLDGELYLQIGEWRSRAIRITEGLLSCDEECLIAGPPDSTFLGTPITATLNAQYTLRVSDGFPALERPTFQTISWSFSSSEMATDLDSGGLARAQRDDSDWIVFRLGALLLPLTFGAIVLIVKLRKTRF